MASAPEQLEIAPFNATADTIEVHNSAEPNNAVEQLKLRVCERLDELDADGLRRVLNSPAGIDLSSNDYLALSDHPLVKSRMAAAVLRDGCGATASRLLRGERESFANVEREFAEFKGTAAALYFGSGYAANLGVLTTFLEAGDLVFSDELNHASLIDGLRLAAAERVIFPHCNLSALEQLLSSARTSGRKFLVTESLFSMDGDEAPLREYLALCRKYETILIVDEAHAVGIYGERGSGLIEEAGIEDGIFLSINPAGKALGAAGAFVAGPRWAIDYLVQRARSFIFSTAPPPAIAEAISASLELIRTEPWRRELLLARVALLRELLSAAGIAILPGRSQIIPVMIGENNRASRLAEDLRAEGFDVRAIRPPTVPPGSARLRLSVNINLDETTLPRFVQAMKKYY